MLQIVITGHSGSGKTTLAKQLGEKLEMPVHHLDKDPAMGAYFERRVAYRDAVGRFDFDKEEAVADLLNSFRDALTRVPSRAIIEGSYFLMEPSLVPEGAMLIVLDVSLATLIERRLKRHARHGRRIGIGDPVELGIELYELYEPGMEVLRGN